MPSLAARAEEFSDAFTGFLQETEHSVVLTFGRTERIQPELVMGG